MVVMVVGWWGGGREVKGSKHRRNTTHFLLRLVFGRFISTYCACCETIGALPFSGSASNTTVATASSNVAAPVRGEMRGDFFACAPPPPAPLPPPPPPPYALGLRFA